MKLMKKKMNCIKFIQNTKKWKRIGYVLYTRIITKNPHLKISTHFSYRNEPTIPHIMYRHTCILHCAKNEKLQRKISSWQIRISQSIIERDTRIPVDKRHSPGRKMHYMHSENSSDPSCWSRVFRRITWMLTIRHWLVHSVDYSRFICSGKFPERSFPVLKSI